MHQAQGEGWIDDDLHARADYVHSLPGRLRVRMTEVRGCAQSAERVTAALQSLGGVHSVHASPRTGSVLVHFDAGAVAAHDVLVRLVDLGVLRGRPPEQPRSEAAPLQCPGCGTRWEAGSPREAGAGFWVPIVRKTAGVVMGELIEFTLKRLVLSIL